MVKLQSLNSKEIGGYMSQDLTAMKIFLLVATQATEGKHSHKVRIKVARAIVMNQTKFHSSNP